MTMQKTSLLLLTPVLALLLTACGGGGGSTTSTPSTPDTTVRDEAQTILDNCLDDATSAFVDLAAVLQLTPGISTPPIEVSDIAGLEIPFLADLDGDMEPDSIGRITIVDPSGQPVMPFIDDDIQNDVTMLLTALATLPDGTRVNISFDPVDSLNITLATFSMTMKSGVPSEIGGVMNQQSQDCATTMQFADETIFSFLGTIPQLDAGIEIVSGDDTVAGTISFKGTATAGVVVTLNGTGPFLFDLDLDTGVLTPTGG